MTSYYQNVAGGPAVNVKNDWTEPPDGARSEARRSVVLTCRKGGEWVSPKGARRMTLNTRR